MPPKKMLTVLYLNHGITWTLFTIIGIVIFICLGIVDFRFYFLALIWLFLFTPLIIAFLYFFYGMKPLTAFNSMPHKIIFNDNDFIIRFFHDKEIENDEESSEREDQENKEEESKEYTVRNEDIEKIKTGSDSVILISKENGWIWVPFYAFTNFDDLKLCLNKFK